MVGAISGDDKAERWKTAEKNAVEESFDSSETPSELWVERSVALHRRLVLGFVPTVGGREPKPRRRHRTQLRLLAASASPVSLADVASVAESGADPLGGIRHIGRAEQAGCFRVFG